MSAESIPNIKLLFDYFPCWCTKYLFPLFKRLLAERLKWRELSMTSLFIQHFVHYCYFDCVWFLLLISVHTGYAQSCSSKRFDKYCCYVCVAHFQDQQQFHNPVVWTSIPWHGVCEIRTHYGSLLGTQVWKFAQGLVSVYCD